MRRDLVLKLLAKRGATVVPEWLKEKIEEARAAPKEKLKDMEKKSGFENLPLLSVNPEEFVYVKFLSEPRDATSKKGKTFKYAECEILEDYVCWDRENEKEIKCKQGSKVAIDVKRHKSLLMRMEQIYPLTSKIVCIANLGEVQMKMGKGFAYSVEVIEGD